MARIESLTSGLMGVLAFLACGVRNVGIDDRGLRVRRGNEMRLLEVDSIVICAGQEPNRALYDELKAAGRPVHRIGGALAAGELDAKRAIDQGTRLAATL
jgi:2,4-dienoyl-CoA reductase (NADPH2)